MNITPTTEQEWTIHALNIHGSFFERWCQMTVANTKDWKLKSTNYPVMFPPQWQGKESALDIRAEYRFQDCLLTLLIECKKNNPNFVNWIFFPKDKERARSSSWSITRIENVQNQLPDPLWTVETRKLSLPSTSIVADEGRETRGTYLQYKKEDKTKTANAVISEAAYQVALATQAIIHEEVRFSEALKNHNPLPPIPYKYQLFLPVIVTTAQLFICDFDMANVDPVTGEIPFGNGKLKSYPYLLYEYPLPRSLQHTPGNLAEALVSDLLEAFARMSILIINSKAFSDTLSTLAGSLPSLPLDFPSQ